MGLSRFAAAARPAVVRMPVRALAAEAESHDPPLKLFGIHARYANAAYTAASKKKMLPKVETELAGFKTVLDRKPAFKQFLGNPTVSRPDKVAAVEKMFTGGKTTEVTKNLMMIMAANNRIGEAGKVADAFAELMRASRGEVDAVVTTAIAMSKDQEKSVLASLKQQFGEVSVTTEVDPEILGGMTVKVGDKFLDLSARSKVTSLLNRTLSMNVE